MCDDGRMGIMDCPVRQIRTIILVTGFTDSNTTILQVTEVRNVEAMALMNVVI